MNVKKFSKYVLFLSIVFLTLSTILYFYGFEMYTSYWHVAHPEPLEWNDFKVTIPDNLVAKRIKNNQVLRLTYMEYPEKALIYFQRVNYHLKKDFNFNDKYKAAGYQIIEKKSCEILGNQCVWIKSYENSEERIYKEDIFFDSKDILISFLGFSEKRNYLLEIVENLKKS